MMKNDVDQKLLNDMLNEIAMDEKHPGIHDADYIQRRFDFYKTSRDYRLDNEGLPSFEYNQTEQSLWRDVFSQLDPQHDKYAFSAYLKGKKALALSEDHIPDLTNVSEHLKQISGFQLGPAEGLLNVRDFFGYIAQRKMPCTQFLRHHTKPAYTPEPDMVHDVIGHVPQLYDHEYADLIETIAKGIAVTPDDRLYQWERIYWFTVEFGLIEEGDDIKAFGAGLLSSFGELEYCFTDEVKKLPLDLAQVIETEYDSTIMQPLLFVIPSMFMLQKEIEKFIASQ